MSGAQSAATASWSVAAPCRFHLEVFLSAASPNQLPAIEVAHSKDNQPAGNESNAQRAEGWVGFGGGRCGREISDAKHFLFVLDSNLGQEKADDSQHDCNNS